MHIDWDSFLPFLAPIVVMLGAQIYGWFRLSTQNKLDQAEISSIETKTENALQERIMKWVAFVEETNDKLRRKIDVLAEDKAVLIEEVSNLRSYNARLQDDLEDCEDQLARS